MYKSICLFLLLVTTVVLNAQSEGTIYGNVKNDAGEAVENADVFIDGTMYSVFTDASGNYELEVEPGAYALIITGIGFEEVTQEITVNAGEKVEFSTQLISSTSSTTQLGEAVVVGQVSKETEVALLNEQRKSVIITENIGAKELERKGVSDVAGAVTKMSGISKQEGSSVVYVRGLGDRYNSTTMNGLPIPSNDPEYKNIDLSIFSTDIVSYIGIDKVYSGTFFGDFAGGNVNIVSKNQTGKGFLKIGMNARGNSNAIKDNNFRLQRGINWLGFDKVSNPNTLSQFQFQNTLNPQKSGSLGSGFSVSGGDSFKVGQSGKLGFFATVGFDNDYTSIDEGFSKTANAQGNSRKDFNTFNLYNYSTNTTGLFNLNYKINNKNTIRFNSLYINSSSQRLEEYYGKDEDKGDFDPVFIRRGTYVKNNLMVNQLLGDHKFGERTMLNWALGYNTIQSDIPDRFQNSLVNRGNGYNLTANSAADNHRYFQELSEDEFVGSLSVEYKFAKNEDEKYKGKITLGYNGRMKKRDLTAIQYNLKPNTLTGQHLTIIDINNLDAFYNSQSFSNGNFDITTFTGSSLTNQFYTGEQNIHGGFANIEYRLSPKLLAVLGLRAEYVTQLVTWNTSLSGATEYENEFDEIEFLPSLNLKYELNEKQNLRFGASKTYTLPQFKERALFMYEEVNETTYGWPTLYPSQDYNADLKWELFPRSGELISVAAFGKYIIDPINKLTVSSASNDMSYANTGDWGYVFGGEIEIRKSIFNTEGSNPTQLTAGVNASYAHSNQELNSEKIFEETLLPSGSRLNADFTHEESAFQGASDLLVNGDVTFSKEWEKGAGFMATVAYNYFSDRIYAVGTNGRGHIVEKGFGTLDFIIRSKITENIGVNFNARNLLNPNVDRVQENESGDVTILHYKKGMNVSLGINYQF